MLDPGAESWVLRPVLPKGHQLSKGDQRAITQILLRRANCLAEQYDVRWQGDDKIVVMLSAVREPGAAAKTLISPGRLDFVSSDSLDLVAWPLAPGSYVRTNSNPNDPDPIIHGAPDDPLPEQVFRTILGGQHLKDAHPLLDTNANVSLALEFTDEGTRILAAHTERYIGEVLAIVLDNIVLLAPQINTPITEGQAIIDSGPEKQWTVVEATCMTTMMNTMLPFPLQVAEHQGGASR
jgi:preprotein translocase subunit SecD